MMEVLERKDCSCCEDLQSKLIIITSKFLTIVFGSLFILRIYVMDDKNKFEYGHNVTS